LNSSRRITDRYPQPMQTAAGVPSMAHGQPHWSGGVVPGFAVPPPHGVRPGMLPGSGPAAVSGPGPSTFPPGAPPHAPVPGTSAFMAPHVRTPPHGSAGMHQPPSGPRGGGYGQPRYNPDDSPDARYRDERAGGWQSSPNGRGQGRGRGRGRGRGSGGGSGEFMGRPVDAGWGRHRSGSQGSPGQEDRTRWDGPSPPRRWA